MARSPFPRGDFGRRTSDNLIGADIGAPAASAAAAVGRAAEGFGRQLRDMAERAWTREGEADAAGVIAASAETGIDPRIRQGRGVDDEAYNAIIREDRLAKRQAAYLDSVAQAKIAHPDNVSGFAEAVAAARSAFTPTGDPRTDTAFARFVTLTDGAALRDVRQGEETRRVRTSRAAFVNAASTAETVLGQTIASAGFDDQGSQLVGAALAQFADQVARFGPREAFSVGGLEFAADPTRTGALAPEELAQLYDLAQVNARTSWITAAGERAPDPASKRAFAGQVRERWAAGDAAFAGLDAPTMDRVTARLEADADRAATDERARVTAIGAMAHDQLKALEYGGDVDPDELRALAEASGDPGLMAEVDYRLANGFQVSPREAGAAGAVGSQGVMNMLLDDLEGPGFVGDDNGRGRAQYGITEASHPAAWRDGKVDRAEAAAIYRREYLAPLGRLTPEMEVVALPAAVIGGVETARGLLAQSGGDPERFLQLEEARFRRLARDNPAKYGDDLPGWLNRLGKVRGALGLARQQVREREGFASDPIGYAVGTTTRAPMATVAPLDPMGVFGDAEAVGAWAQAVRARSATGAELSRVYRVPERVLTDVEVGLYKEQFARDPASLTTFATAAAGALGLDRARTLLQDVGRGGLASADVHLASLAMDPATRPAATLATEGRVLRASGAQPARFEEGSIREAVQSLAVPVLSNLPDVMPAIEALADDMAVADAARGALKTPEAYVNAALGATTRGGHVFGGVSRQGSGDKARDVLIPPWLRADALDEAQEMAVQQMADAGVGPVYDSGRPIPARRLAQYQLRRGRTGYQLVNPDSGMAAVGPDGRLFTFDFASEQFRRAFAGRYPDLAVAAPR